MNQKINVKRQILVAMALIAFIAGISSCEKYSFLPPTVNPTDTVHFSTVIQPIFTKNCVTCHGGLRAPNLSVGKAWESLTTGGYVNQPGDQSILYTQMNAADHASRSSALEKEEVLTWINQGALDN